METVKDRIGTEVEAEYSGSTIWAPLYPGESRQVWVRWIVPADADMSLLRIPTRSFFYYFDHEDAGAWGDITDRSVEVERPDPSLDTLLPPCQRESCERLGINMEAAYISLDTRRGQNNQWYIDMRLNPYPDTSDLSGAAIRIHHEGQTEVYFPTGNPWDRIVESNGYINVHVYMPTMQVPLYVRLFLPDGTTLNWKTIAPLRDTLFSNPDWVWESPESAWPEQQAITIVDTICWAHWTAKRDPHELYPVPVYFSETEEEWVTITREMINWAIKTVCEHKQ